MLGKKSSVAPILAFLKENDVSTAIIHICTKTRSWWCMYHRLKINFFFLGGGGGGGGEGGGGGGGGGRGEEREGVWKGSLDNRQQQSHSPLQVNLRKSSDRAMSGRLKCMLKRDTGKRFL